MSRIELTELERAKMAEAGRQSIPCQHGWQPIDTAPRDGTDILVMYIHISTQCVFNAFWINYEEGLNEPEDEGWWSYVWSEVGRTLNVRGTFAPLTDKQTPTYWLPLPQPPEGQK